VSEFEKIIIDEKRPYVPKGSHPIETGNYNLPTAEILKLYDGISRWINNRAPGAIVYGRPRLGKTRAIRIVKNFIQEEFGENMPIFQMCCNKYKVPSENRFFTDVLKNIGHSMYLSGKAEAKRDRATRFLIERAEASAQHRIILFIDDAQRLHELEYSWLMDIYNELDRYNIALTAILVGQEELVHQRSAFIQSRKMQLVGRFMIHEYKFSGIKTIDDLNVCLTGYDSISDYPEGSGWSYTRYYFPAAYAEGKRLEGCAEELFNQFKELREELNITKPMEIPMQYLTLTIDYCLRTFGIDGKGVEFPTAIHWGTSIKNSGYVESELYRNMFE
jgi:hypothetical protein